MIIYVENNKRYKTNRLLTEGSYSSKKINKNVA